MEKIKTEINVLVLARDKEVTIASTIYKIQNDIDSVSVSVTVFDNGSTDDTSTISSMAGAYVVRYRTRHDRSVIFKRAILEARKTGSRITVILDLLGENTAEDAVKLANTAISKGEDFTIGYVEPERGFDTVGCLALDQKSVDMLAEKQKDALEILKEMALSSGIATTRFTDSLELVSSNKVDREASERSTLIGIWRIVNKNPLKFYGGAGAVVILFAMASGFYTVNYFYVHNVLYYTTAFITVLLVMISGFLMGAGIMLNALAIMVERVRASKKWERSNEIE